MAGTNPSPKRGEAAIFYHPDGYVTGRGRLMGRHAAGEGFLFAFARHARQRRLYAYCETQEQFGHFRRQVESAASKKPSEWLPTNQPERLAGPGTLYLPHPSLAGPAWLRRGCGSTSYSITGITHTICTHRVMDSVGELLTSPVEQWDALICTSESVRRGVDGMLAAYGEYLQERLGAAAARPNVRLPVIPLGVDCDGLAGGVNALSLRQNLRRRHHIGKDDVCVLFMGRLSYHAKAHPLPMYQALEVAARNSDRKLHLIQSGWFANDSIKGAFEQAAHALCPSVQVINVDGRRPEIRKNVWRAADIFCSLSDNVQETFGLTPVEAMAAGLPVVATDWDGYRGTVEEGVTGFLVHTTIPSQGNGEELAYRHFSGRDTYDQYLGNVCQSVAVDSGEVARAFAELVANPELRQRMGDAGRARARAYFDWPVVIAAYQELWDELAQCRRQAEREEGAARPRSIPLRADPYAVFGHYASRVMDDGSHVELATADPMRMFHRLSKLRINRLGRDVLETDQEIEHLIEQLADAGAMGVGSLLDQSPNGERAALSRTLVWLAKLGIVKIVG